MRMRVLTWGVAAAACGAFALAPLASAHPSKTRHSSPTVVTVVIVGQPQAQTPGRILFSPTTVKQGPVVLKITNTDGEWHNFEIDNVFTRLMGPNGGMATLRMTFKRPGVYYATCPDDEFGISGTFKVTAVAK